MDRAFGLTPEDPATPPLGDFASRLSPKPISSPSGATVDVSNPSVKPKMRADSRATGQRTSGQAIGELSSDLVFLWERTTGFEPATLTLAKVILFVHGSAPVAWAACLSSQFR